MRANFFMIALLFASSIVYGMHKSQKNSHMHQSNMNARSNIYTGRRQDQRQQNIIQRNNAEFLKGANVNIQHLQQDEALVDAAYLCLIVHLQQNRHNG